MPITFPYRDANGTEHAVELVVDINDLDIDAAEAVEEAVGADIRAINDLTLTRQLRVLAFASIRRVDPDAALRDVGRVKLGPLLRAFETMNPAPEEAPTPASRDVDFTANVAVQVDVTTPEPAGEEVLSPTNAGSGS